MKKIKEFIKNYIRTELEKLIKIEFEEAQKEIKKLQGYLNEYSNYTCYQCGKAGVAHYGGFYRNFEGKVFCSHECIDNNKPLTHPNEK